MAEVRPRCRLYLQLPMRPAAGLQTQLSEAIAKADVAGVLLCREGASIEDVDAGHLVALVQQHGIACLVEHDPELAARLRADGVHIEADTEAYRHARNLLGKEASIGAACGLSRHDAMRLAELGADYVAFGPDAGSNISAVDQCAELIAWWAEIFVAPCVAWNVADADTARRLTAAGADFIAPSKEIWQRDGAANLVAELEGAIRQARRAA